MINLYHPKKHTCTTSRPCIERPPDAGTAGTAKTAFFSLQIFKKINFI